MVFIGWFRDVDMSALQQVPDPVRPTSWKTVAAGVIPAVLVGFMLALTARLTYPVSVVGVVAIAAVVILYLGREPDAPAAFGVGMYLVAVSIVVFILSFALISTEGFNVIGWGIGMVVALILSLVVASAGWFVKRRSDLN